MTQLVTQLATQPPSDSAHASTFHGAVSPSLVARGEADAPAFELKFLVDEPTALAIEAWARRTMSLDPHGSPALGGAYDTATLYLDTPELDVYHRSPSYKRRKFRIRRYGSAAWVSLEQKSKRGDRVRKRRSSVPLHELGLLTALSSLERTRDAAPPAIDAAGAAWTAGGGESQPVGAWPGGWFGARIAGRRLVPACLVTNRRTALVGTCAEGPLRLTIDRDVRGRACDPAPIGEAPGLGREDGPPRDVEWSWRSITSSPPGAVEADGAIPLLPRAAILELKFLHALPIPFKQLVRDSRLSPQSLSKYRLFRDALARSPDGRSGSGSARA